MWDIFVFAFNAVMPIILLIVLGYVLKRKKFLNDSFLNMANKFVFKICLPCLLFVNVYSISSLSEIDWSVVIYSEIAIILFFIVGVIATKFLVKDRKKKGVVLQCVFRSNFAIIGLSLAESLGGESGKAVAAVLSAFSIPTFNILAVIALSMYLKSETLDDTKTPWYINVKNVLINIIKNPLIIGVVLGLICLGIRSFIPLNDNNELVWSFRTGIPFLYTSIVNISRIGSPLALIVLGGLFNFQAVKGMLKEVIIGVSARLVIVPVIAIGVAVILSKYTNIINFEASTYPALIALFGSPVAVSSAIMAKQMDNDGELAGQLVVWTSLLSIITIFLFVVVLRSMGLL